MTAYGLLGALPAQLRATLIDERHMPGAGAGVHFAAATVVAQACQMLEHRGEIEISDLAPMNASYTIDGHTFEAGYELSAIYRRK